eukprot:scaffold115634_cov35-Prasinocladus_malaysianus.AAC.1
MERGHRIAGFELKLVVLRSNNTAMVWVVCTSMWSRAWSTLSVATTPQITTFRVMLAHKNAKARGIQVQHRWPPIEITRVAANFSIDLALAAAKMDISLIDRIGSYADDDQYGPMDGNDSRSTSIE